MSTYFEATIRFFDNGDIVEGMIFKNGDFDENDDDGVFYYIENDNDMDKLKENGVLDFIILSYEKL